MKFKGTKGKWFACCINETPHYIFNENSEVTICQPFKEQDMDDISLEEFKANALLISKAPEMLEMLIKLTSTMDYKNIEDAKQLIKEATEIK